MRTGAGLFLAIGFCSPVFAETVGDDPVASFLGTYCMDCHTGDDAEAGFRLDVDHVAELNSTVDVERLEKSLRRVTGRQMPPIDASRPSDDEYAIAESVIEGVLDDHAAAHPNPGRTDSIRRLTRTEYQNSIRDLLGMPVDGAELLPPDESSHGFDNITVGELSPMLISRYVSAAQKIARAAIGRPGIAPIGTTIRIPADRTQSAHVQGLPIGTRGGTVFSHHFAADGEYEFELRLTRDRDEKVEGLTGSHSIDVLIDDELRHRFTVKPPPRRGDYTHVDSHLRVRVPVTGGVHRVGVTFEKKRGSLVESKRQPFDASFNRHRHPRSEPALFQISLVGPFSDDAKDTPPRRSEAIFGDASTAQWSGDPAVRLEQAESILRPLMRRAYRRPVTDDDLISPVHFFVTGDAENGFEAGIEDALASILVNPNFLFRIETDPRDVEPGQPYRISDLELASRLSFFLWSSLPDDELLSLAGSNRLHDADILTGQVERMLADDRAESLTTNFASQWLYLRNLDSITPDLRLFPDFDDNLRQSFRGETEAMFRGIVAHNESVLRLIDSKTTYLNQRLAQHYGIAGVFGSHFRAVDVSADSHRGGILRHGSILMVTSYATRTSPTIRGHWILKNVLGTPTPPPPPNIPNLAEKSTLVATSVRERLAMHRANPACASCHDLMDPIGFALENFDAVGRWRTHDGELLIDSSGTMPDGIDIDSVDDLEAALLARPEIFVTAMTEKLLTFALGRGVTHSDGPAIRRIVRAAGDNEFRFASLVEAIVRSEPFTHRAVHAPNGAIK